MEKKVLEYINKNKLIEKNDKVLVAVSGGPDSICLLNILYNLKNKLEIEIFVAHINHLIREDAYEDMEYVKKFCEDKNILCFIKECNVKEISKEKKIGLEEAGRIVRYKFFDEITNKYNINKIAIGHNKNDHVETLIMNMLRGAGTSGLVSILNKNGKYIRPLLNIERKEIEKYCNEQDLSPKIDSTNFDNNYTRNKVRNIVIPYIKENFNPNIIETLSRFSKIIEEEQNYIDIQVEKEFLEIVKSTEDNKILIDGKKFSNIHISIKRRIILYIIKKLFGNTKEIEKNNIDDIIKLIDRNIGKKYLMINKKFKVTLDKGIATFYKN